MSGSDEVDDMDEEVGESSDSLPTATAPTGKWKATSTYDIYMVDMPHNSGSGNTNNGGGGDGNGNRDNNNGNNANPDDNTNNPGTSLGPDDNDILNESLNSPNHDTLRLRLVRMVNKITNEK